VLAGRTAGALAGWVACLALWALGAALGAPLAGAAGALLLASQPLWLANARRAGLDAPALALGLLAALAVVLALRRWGPDREPRGGRGGAPRAAAGGRLAPRRGARRAGAGAEVPAPACRPPGGRAPSSA